MRNVGYGTKSTNIKTYRRQKIQMLEKEFKLNLTSDEKNHFNELETEAAIDRYARTVIKQHWA